MARRLERKNAAASVRVQHLVVLAVEAGAVLHELLAARLRLINGIAPSGREEVVTVGTHLAGRHDTVLVARRDAPLAARTRNGCTSVVREQLFKKGRAGNRDCPFVNLPEAKSGRWGASLTAAKMKDCRWLKPVLVAGYRVSGMDGRNHLRHTISLRCDGELLFLGPVALKALSDRIAVGAITGSRSPNVVQ